MNQYNYYGYQKGEQHTTECALRKKMHEVKTGLSGNRLIWVRWVRWKINRTR